MDNIIYNATSQYYTALSKLGYYKYGDVYSLLVLGFLRDFIYKDYHGLISEDDYHIIDKALSCLFGSNCLLPYPDYLKNGRLYGGKELSQRTKALEDTKVLQVFKNTNTSNSETTEE